MILQVGVRTSLATELPTKIGRSFMKRYMLQHMIVIGVLALTLGACVHTPQKITKTEIPVELDSSPPQEIVLLQEARTESVNMRAELASLKILMAKQEGELRSLRKQSHAIHDREQDQGLQLQKIRSQLLSTELERDQLQKYKMSMEDQAEGTPDTTQLVSDIQAIRTSFQELMGTMQGLVSDMHFIKQEIRLPTIQNRPQQAKQPKNPPSMAIAETLTPDDKGRITIQEGDTLWELSLTHGVSVDQLRQWNHLSGDLILTGRHLQVAETMQLGEEQHKHAMSLEDTSSPIDKEETFDNLIQDTLPSTAENTAELPSEPKNIYSLANP